MPDTSDSYTHVETPGPDPRMRPEYINSVMRPNKSSAVAEEPSRKSLTALLKRLDALSDYTNTIHNGLHLLNERLAGPQPTEAGPESASSPAGGLNCAHSLVDEINYRLQRLDMEVSRLAALIGE